MRTSARPLPLWHGCCSAASRSLLREWRGWHDLADAVNREDLPPLVQAALVHAQFETIHPFEDGNGRTGRALVQVVFRRRGIAPDYVPPVSVIWAAERDA